MQLFNSKQKIPLYARKSSTDLKNTYTFLLAKKKMECPYFRNKVFRQETKRSIKNRIDIKVFRCLFPLN